MPDSLVRCRDCKFFEEWAGSDFLLMEDRQEADRRFQGICKQGDSKKGVPESETTKVLAIDSEMCLASMIVAEDFGWVMGEKK